MIISLRSKYFLPAFTLFDFVYIISGEEKNLDLIFYYS